jgi:SAM-dependent methyltransferase
MRETILADYDEKVLSHYKNVAGNDGASPASTMADTRTRQLETELITGFVERAIKALARQKAAKTPVLFDIGCGNGYTLSVLAGRKTPAALHGFEYSPDLRKIASERDFGSPDAVAIHPADIRDPQWSGGEKADIAYTQRVVINLMSVTDQVNAMNNIIASVNTGGYVLFIEAFDAALANLNAARGEFGFPDIPPAHHNLLLADDFFKQFKQLKPLSPASGGVHQNFLSTHYFAARVLHPLALRDMPFRHNSLFVQFMSGALAQNVGDFSPIRAYAFQKTSA